MHGVAARHQVVEAVGAVERGRGAPRFDASSGLQHDQHTSQRDVAAAVGVSVFVHGAAQAAGLRRLTDETGVHRAVRLATFQGHRAGAASGLVGVTVGDIVAHFCGREAPARRRNEFNRVRPGHQVGEQVATARSSGLRANDVASAVDEVDDHVGHTPFTRVLLPIGIGVQPHAVAEGSELVEPRIDGAAVFSGCKHLHVGHQAIAVDIPVATGLSRAGTVVAVGLHKADLIVRARRQALEAVVAQAVGNTRGQHFIEVVEVAVAVAVAHQFDTRTGYTKVTGVLNPIGVFVFKHAITHFGGTHFDQRGLLLFTRGITHVQHQTQDLPGLGNEAIIGQSLAGQRTDAGRVRITKGIREPGPVITDQRPDGGLDFAPGVVCAVVIVDQPVDRIEIVQCGRARADRQPGCAQRAELIARIDRAGGRGVHVEEDVHGQAPAVEHGAGRAEQGPCGVVEA